MRIFIYGTLLQGLHRHYLIKNSVLLGPGKIVGKLWDLGNYPGLTQGDGSVIGELFESDTNTIQQLDIMEVFYQKLPSKSLFIRKSTEVRLFSGDVTYADCYFYNGPVNYGSPISCGDYRRHLIEKTSSTQWLAFYGSNLSSKRLIKRIEPPIDVMKGYIPNFKLVFNKLGVDSNSRANIQFKGNDPHVLAVAYLLKPEQVSMMDNYEGEPDHYMRISTIFRDEKNIPKICQTYIANPDMLVPEKVPSSDYLTHIMKGYLEYGFPIPEI